MQNIKMRGNIIELWFSIDDELDAINALSTDQP